MDRIAKFEKVSYDQFKKDFLSCFGWKEMITYGFVQGSLENPDEEAIENFIKETYDNIKIPKRATKGSMGHDFCSPVSMFLNARQTIKIPTGIRCKIEHGWGLMLYPRSGLGFKFRLQLDNTVGVIDSDYFNSDNEGHIMAKITNDTTESKIANIEAGKGFMQGIFMPYGITVDDDAEGVRNGGFGSTDKKE